MRAREVRGAFLLSIAAGLLIIGAPCANARIHRTFTSAAYFSNRPLADSTEARFLAKHYDIYIGQVAPFAGSLRKLNKGIVLSFMRSCRAITDVGPLEEWASENPKVSSESMFLHYDRDVDLGHGRIVKGWRPECSPDRCAPPATATSEAESRAPDLTGDGPDWLLLNPRDPGLVDYDAFTLHERKEWYAADGVFWDWAAGGDIPGANRLSATREYAGTDDRDRWAHPFIAESIGLMDAVMRRFRDLYPKDPEYRYTACNVVSPIWTFPRPEGNGYRDALLRSRVGWLFYEYWMTFDEEAEPTRDFPCDEIDLRYLKETVSLGEEKRIHLQIDAVGSAPGPRTKILLLGLAYLVQDPDRFAITYRYQEPERNRSASIDDWLWIPAMDYDLGVPVLDPQGTRDVFGRNVSSCFYEWAKGPDPSNPKRTFHIYARSYEKALVLVKLREAPDDPWDWTTATTHDLPRTYRPLLADGTLGPPIQRVRLRNDEAVILIP